MDHRSTILLTLFFFIADSHCAIINKRVERESVTVPPSDISEHDICMTPGCINTASDVLKKMDKSVNPCDNFYKFACGGYIKSTIIPDDTVEVDTFSLISDKIQEQLRTIIEEPSLPTELKPFRLLKNLYKSCMNKTAVEAEGFAPLLKDLKKLGGWPVLEDNGWSEDTFDWIQATHKLKSLGYSTDFVLTFDIDTDLKNTTKRALYVTQARLGLSHEYLSRGLDDDTVKAYYSYMVDIAVILGAKRETAEEQLLSSLRFEIALANISVPNEELRDATLLYNPMTITNLSGTYPSIPWKEYINRLLPSTVQADDSDIVIVMVPSFLEDLEKLMKDTSKRVQANYVMWRAVKESILYLNEEIRKRQLQYWTVVKGTSERESRWKECLYIISIQFPVIPGALYVRKYFDNDTKKDVNNMVHQIKHQFSQMLQSAAWMDDGTKKSALEKAATMTTHIAYPDEILDDSKIVELFQGLEIDGNDYYQGIVNVSLFIDDYYLSQLRKPVNASDWVAHEFSVDVDAYYVTTENSIVLPAGILQGAFFSSDRPMYMNYGGIGSIIGHEITHGFDDEGRQFDKGGNLIDWWAASTADQYLDRARCIVEQYANYTVEEVGLKLNGVTTQGENIADNGGAKAAYLAYRNWVEANGKEPLLPGLPYNQRQMFWLSTANIWCTVERPEVLKATIATDPHSPVEFRIVGTLSNLPEFAEDFECSAGTRMNPVKKCAVW